MKKKFLSTLIIGGIICSGSTVVFAKENPKSISHQNTKNISTSKKIDCKESDDLESLKQLSYSIEEMEEADSILNNGDLTNKDTYNRMLTFASTSLDRIRTLKDENLTEEANTNIDFISSIGDEVRIGCNNANELILAIRNVGKVFSSPKNNSDDKKENALYSLNDIIVKNAKEKSLNKKTLATACNILHKYANITSHKEENTKITEESSKESAYNIEQMNYAIEEMKEACKLLDNADLSKLSNYERMIRFATASLDRSRSLNLNKNSNLACHLDWIEESGDSIRNTTGDLNNLITIIREEKEIFASYSHATNEEKKATLSKLDELINKENFKNHLNKTTLENVKNLIANYHNQLNDTKVTDENVTTKINNKVDTGVGNDSITETDLDNMVTTGTQSNIIVGTDSSTETNFNNSVTTSTQTDLDNAVTTGTQVDMTTGTDSSTETNLNNSKMITTQTDMGVGTDSITDTTSTINNDFIIQNNLKDNIDTNIKKELSSLHINNKINTSVKSEEVAKNKTNIATEVKQANNVTICAEKKTLNKINKVTTPVSAVATQTNIAPVSAVATQTDIAPVSAVATQTDIVPVSAVATQTDTNTETKNDLLTIKDKSYTNKEDMVKNNNFEEKEKNITKADKQNNTPAKKSKKTSYELLGLGLITTLVCTLLKKFI